MFGISTIVHDLNKMVFYKKKGVDNASEKHLSIHRWESETLDRENTKGQSAFFIRLTQRKKPGCIGERRYSNTRR